MKTSEKGQLVSTEKRVVAENSLFHVLFENITGAGKTVCDYLVVDPKKKTQRGATGVAVLPILNDKFALLEVWRPAMQAFCWEVPRGFVELGEGHLESVARELEEETGLKCSKENIVSLGYMTPEAGILRARIHLFLAKATDWNKNFEPTEFGHRQLKWFTEIEMNQKIEQSVIEDACTLICFQHYLLNKKKRS